MEEKTSHYGSNAAGYCVGYQCVYKRSTFFTSGRTRKLLNNSLYEYVQLNFQYKGKIDLYFDLKGM